MMIKKTTKQNLPTYSVIANAINGDVNAVNAVLKHYEGYIATLATKQLYDSNGNIYRGVDEDLRRRLETKLITAIVTNKFKIK